jgi:hypothetical protein
MTRTSTRQATVLTMLIAVAATAPGAAQARTGEERPDRPCFIEQSHWDVALDWPVPRC